MTEVIGVKFRSDGRIYSFSPKNLKFVIGDYVIVQTSQGIECGEVASENHSVSDSSLVAPLKEILRPANAEDMKKIKDNKKKELDAFHFCEKRILERKLQMKLVDVEIGYEGSKILFFFTADGRIDFRELVKDLAGTYRTRIELRQIGVRDEAKMLGGLGTCGQPFCCSRFLNDFQPVSIKMAKEQGLSLNPAKISGACGRLMCCLKYEQDAYEYLNKMTPRVGSMVSTPDGNGTVTDVSLLTGFLKVSIENSDSLPITIHRDQVTKIGGCRGCGKDK